MPDLRADLHDLLSFEMLSRHTLDILRHKYGVSEGELFSGLMQVLRERRVLPERHPNSREPGQLVCSAEEHICRHCGEILLQKNAMKHLWQVHDLVVRQHPEAHYTTDIRLAALYQQARAAGTDAQSLLAAWEATQQFEQRYLPVRADGQRRYLVRRRGYTILVLGQVSLNGRYQRRDLNQDNRRHGFMRCLRGTFILVPMRA
ncbi:hypothetical protein [Hymenobacter swuensis]|uniref:Uncharacterized protein n=1 Tax=Hymenobacter swuensis DY53 TaxID=1227739 RepID=W8ES88_9BACT|nr:hypothetical protein [Hymenobacter swuensis]AHJ95999.1 hypothetical protein Hsw_0404 [Hymenobacter swuensis DY53]